MTVSRAAARTHARPSVFCLELADGSAFLRAASVCVPDPAQASVSASLSAPASTGTATARKNVANVSPLWQAAYAKVRAFGLSCSALRGMLTVHDARAGAADCREPDERGQGQSRNRCASLFTGRVTADFES